MPIYIHIYLSIVSVYLLLLPYFSASKDYHKEGTKVCRYSWHSAGSLVWPFTMLKYKYIYQIKYRPTETILSNSTRKLSSHNSLRGCLTKLLPYIFLEKK